MAKIGYARVSSTGQSLESQLERLRSHGCQTIFREKISGAKAVERDLIAIRTAEGRERAKKNDVRFGPKPKLSFHQIEEIGDEESRESRVGSLTGLTGYHRIRSVALGSSLKNAFWVACVRVLIIGLKGECLTPKADMQRACSKSPLCATNGH